MMIAISQFLMILGICLWASSLIYSNREVQLEVDDESTSEIETIDLEV